MSKLDLYNKIKEKYNLDEKDNNVYKLRTLMVDLDYSEELACKILGKNEDEDLSPTINYEKDSDNNYLYKINLIKEGTEKLKFRNIELEEGDEVYIYNHIINDGRIVLYDWVVAYALYFWTSPPNNFEITKIIRNGNVLYDKERDNNYSVVEDEEKKE